jgi:CO/xanthine dehydrogenase Mo-binding subunit
MTGAAEAVAAGHVLAGHTRISTQALTSLAQTVAADALGVLPNDVRADWSDDDGLLALAIASPIRIPPLHAVLRDPARADAFGGSVWDRAVAAKAIILARVAELSGSQLRRVDIRISGARIMEGGRVQ